MPSYLASVEVDRRQAVIAQADKLREMLGGSMLIAETLPRAASVLKIQEDGLALRSSRFPGVQIAQRVSGVLYLRAESLGPLINALGALREAFVHDLGLPVTFAAIEIRAGTSFDECLRLLDAEVRQVKESKAGAGGTPQSPFFARCQIQPHLPATIWRPASSKPSLNLRRRLVHWRSEQRFEGTRNRLRDEYSKFTAVRSALDAGLDLENVIATDVSHLAASPDDSYVAFLAADGDGMGRLVSTLNYKTLAQDQDFRSAAGVPSQEEPVEPWHAARLFGDTLESCLENAYVESLNALTSGMTLSSDVRFPFSPLVRAGEDFWILCRRDLALPLFLALEKNYRQQAAANPILQAAMRTAGLATSEKLTISAGVLFVKAGYPFDAQLHLAEELTRNAKCRRAVLPSFDLKQGCVDFHWYESGARESIASARAASSFYQDSSGALYRLHTRPWTAAELESMLALARQWRQGLPSRKIAELDRIVRHGCLSGLAMRHWAHHLTRKQQEIVLDTSFPGPCAGLSGASSLLSAGGRGPWQSVSGELWTPLVDVVDLIETESGVSR